jgi:hypothetical protein
MSAPKTLTIYPYDDKSDGWYLEDQDGKELSSLQDIDEIAEDAEAWAKELGVKTITINLEPKPHDEAPAGAEPC